MRLGPKHPDCTCGKHWAGAELDINDPEIENILACPASRVKTREEFLQMSILQNMTHVWPEDVQ